MLARSRELIRCRCALSSSSHACLGAGGGPSSAGGASSALLLQSRISIQEPTRACTTRNNSTSIAVSRMAPTSQSAIIAGLSVSASAADLAFVSSLAAHFQEQHQKKNSQSPFYLQHHHRRSPFAHVADSRAAVAGRQSQQHGHKHKLRVAHAQPRVKKSSGGSSNSSGSSSAVKVKKALRVESEEKECELPMDMECGCKTKRLKEQQEAEALAKAAALRVPVVSSNQSDDAAVTMGVTVAAVDPAALSVVVTNSNPVHPHGHHNFVSNESSFHRRHLPQDCIAFSSPEGRKLFTQAINCANNYMQIYFPLAEQFITQAEPAFCGLATLAMCLNALQIDPGRLWKGPWRWFSEELFDCCTSLSVAKEKGISLSEFICLARCNGVLTDDMRADSKLSLDEFRSIVKHSCSTNNEIVVLNYSRKVLGQTGDGHFSPIGGYHEENDMVLLLDVARFKYPPHWVRLPLVYEAMQKIDESIGLPRGLVVLKENAHATGPTLVKQLVHSATPELPLKPAPQPCCYSAASVESARHIAAFANQS